MDGLFLCHSVACSKEYAIFSTVSSSIGLPRICNPMGRFSFVNPHGRERPGIPARLHEMVKISERYMVRGSATFSPILNAGVGEVGVTITSHLLNASSKSFFIMVLTCDAFL